MLFKLDLVKGDDFDLLNVGFTAVVATNCELVQYVDEIKEEILKDCGGKLLRINGACSLVILSNLMPDFAYYYGAVAFYDPKLEGFVVGHSENPDFKVGQLLK